MATATATKTIREAALDLALANVESESAITKIVLARKSNELLVRCFYCP